MNLVSGRTERMAIWMILLFPFLFLWWMFYGLPLMLARMISGDARRWFLTVYFVVLTILPLFSENGPNAGGVAAFGAISFVCWLLIMAETMPSSYTPSRTNNPTQTAGYRDNPYLQHKTVPVLQSAIEPVQPALVDKYGLYNCGIGHRSPDTASRCKYKDYH